MRIPQELAGSLRLVIVSLCASGPDRVRRDASFMHYQEIEPAGELAHYIECFWRFSSGSIDHESATHIIVPDGTVSLSCIALPAGQTYVGVSGPSTLAHRSQLIPGARYYGIRLRAGAAGSIFRTDIAQFRDVFGPVSEPMPDAFCTLAARLESAPAGRDILHTMHDAAMEIVAVAAPIDRPVHDYCSAIMQANGMGALADLASQLPISERHLRRKFAYQCGLSAKEFARLRRARHACLVMLHSPQDGLAQAATRAGFSDQAHMTREFGQIFGHSAKLTTDYLRQVDHGDLVQTIS